MPTNIRRTGITGKQSFQRDVERLRAAITTSGGAGGGSDHGALIGLSDDDHSQYAHLSQDETVLGQWDFSPASPQAPFTLGANAQGQKVVDFNADELEGWHASQSPGANEVVVTDASSIANIDILSLTTGVASDLFPTLTDTYDLGSSAKLWRKGYLSELEALLFVEESIHVEGGWLIVGHDQGTIESDVVGDTPGPESDTIDFGKTMTPGDFVLFRAYLQVEYMEVGTLVSGTTYNVDSGVDGERDLDGSGADDWPQGSVFLVLGTTGDGRIELVASQTDSPRISILEQGATYNAQSERVRIGNMRDSYGVGSNDYYGFGVGDYSGGNYLRYNPTDGFDIKGGDGGISLTADGLEIINNSGSSTSTSAIRFNHLTNPSTWEGQVAATWTASLTELLIQVEHTSPHDATIRMYATPTSSDIWIDCEGPIILQSDVGIDSDLYGFGLGSVTITDGDLRVVEDVVAGGGIFAGNDAADPANGFVYATNGAVFGASSGATVGAVMVTGDVRLTGGLTVGNLTTNAATGDVYLTGQIFIAGTSNSDQVNGLTVRQSTGGASNQAITLRESGVAHAMTTFAGHTENWLMVREITDNVGGAVIYGFAETTRPMIISGHGVTETTTTSTSSIGMMEAQGAKRSGAGPGSTALGSTGNVFVVTNYATTELIVKGNGSLYVNLSTGSSSVGLFDEYDDIKLLTGARALMLPTEYSLRQSFNEFVDYARPILESTGAIVVNDGQYGNSDDGSVFMQVQGMIILIIDTVRQQHEEILGLKDQVKVLQLEARNESNK